jgi:2,4-dienoyl-CoA reductase-like NADH-dependent reductase (Old Yellow Enzyme family)
MRHFHYKNLDELRRNADELGARHVRFEEDKGEIRRQVSRPMDVGGFRVGNALAIHPMEGCDSTLDGRPDELTWRRYERFAAGGAKLLWFEATAVRQDGRANARQLWITPDNVSDYARLLEKIRLTHRERWGTADDLLEPMQLTHSGRYSYPTRSIVYHNPFIDKKSGTAADYPVITDDELERLEDDYVAAARLGVYAGFRPGRAATEVHLKIVCGSSGT